MPANGNWPVGSKPFRQKYQVKYALSRFWYQFNLLFLYYHTWNYISSVKCAKELPAVTESGKKFDVEPLKMRPYVSSSFDKISFVFLCLFLINLWLSFRQLVHLRVHCCFVRKKIKMVVRNSLLHFLWWHFVLWHFVLVAFCPVTFCPSGSVLSCDILS